MAKFERSFPLELQEALKSTDLYQKCLLPDIKSGEVFPAFRNNEIHFYHKGGRLFAFKGNVFKTDVNHASVLFWDRGKKDIEEPLLMSDNVRLIRNFSEGYQRIKDNCEHYAAGLEAKGSAKICSLSSYISNQDIVILDAEVAFPESESSGRLDVDLLFFNKKERALRFFEAKHYSNSKLFSEQGAVVLAQIREYTSQIIARRDEILQAYKKYTQSARKLFELSEDVLPAPESVVEDVALLIFGFDEEQKRRLDEKLLKSGNLNGVYYRSIGDISTQTAADVWNQTELGE